MAYLAAQIDAARAAQEFRRESLWKRLGKRLRPMRNANPRFPYTEGIWFPFYFIRIHVVSRKGPGSFMTMLDGWRGSFSIVQGEFDTLDGHPEGGGFPPKLTGPEAETMARQQLSRSILAQRSFGPKPEITGHDAAECLQYPLYVYYHERRPGRIDIRVLDGISGELTGAKLKQGILDAFTEYANAAPHAPPTPSH